MSKTYPTFDQLFRAADREARDILLGSGVDPLASGGDPRLFQEALDRVSTLTRVYFEEDPEEAEEDRLARRAATREYAAYFIGLAVGCRLNGAPRATGGAR
jgi:hypothetical protein